MGSILQRCGQVKVGTNKSKGGKDHENNFHSARMYVPGRGWLLKCIDKNDAKVSSRCKEAIKQVGLK